jgi:hypothetical protein
MEKGGVFQRSKPRATDSTYGCTGQRREVVVVTGANDDQ